MHNYKIIGRQEIGKTTYLYKQYKKALIENKNIIILDSATDHQEKSLIKKVSNNNNNCVIFPNNEKESIKLSADNRYHIDSLKNYPSEEILSNYGKIQCFDLGFFLEKAYIVYKESYSKVQFDYYRELYRCISQQIINCILELDFNNLLDDTLILMDEIELPITNRLILGKQKRTQFIASVHEENSFGTFYNELENYKLKPYVKKK